MVIGEGVACLWISQVKTPAGTHSSDTGSDSPVDLPKSRGQMRIILIELFGIVFGIIYYFGGGDNMFGEKSSLVFHLGKFNTCNSEVLPGELIPRISPSRDKRISLYLLDGFRAMPRSIPSSKRDAQE